MATTNVLQYRTLDAATGTAVHGDTYVDIDDTNARYFCDSEDMIAFHPSHPNIHLMASNDTVSMQAAIDLEKSERVATDALLATSVSLTNVDNDLRALVSAEVATRQANDDALENDYQNLVTTESAARQLADADEAALRDAADTALMNNVNTEAATRSLDDSVLQANINAEAATRQTEDAALQALITADGVRMDALEARIVALEALSHDPLTFTELAGAYATLTGQSLNIPRVTDVTTDLQAQITANDADIAANLAERILNDTAIAANLAERILNDTAIAANLAERILNDTDIAALDTRLTTAENNITANDGDITALQAQITANDADIAANLTERILNDTDIATNLAERILNDTDIANVTARIVALEADSHVPLVLTTNDTATATLNAATQVLNVPLVETITVTDLENNVT